MVGHIRQRGWFGQDPLPLAEQVSRPYTKYCRCKHCTWRRAYLRDFHEARWPARAASALRRNAVVLDVIASCNDA